jgi:hypothetical protein
MSVLSWLKPATLAVTVVAAGSLLAPAPVQAQVTVLRGSPSQPLQPSVQDNNQDNQSSNYSTSGYGDDYPYYGDDFPWGGGGIGRGSHRGGFMAVSTPASMAVASMAAASMVAVYMAAVFMAAEGIADNPEANRSLERFSISVIRDPFDHRTILQRQPPHDFTASA